MRHLLIILLLFQCGRLLASSPSIEGLAYLADPTGTETISTVTRPSRAGDFIASPQGLAAGYTRSVHWLRFTLQAPPDGIVLLEVQPPYLDDLQLYVPDGHGGYVLRQSGDRHPFSSRDVPARSFVFRFDLPDDGAHTVYLRVQTSSTSLVVLRAFRQGGYAEALASEYLLLGLYYGLLLAMLLFNVWHGHWRHAPDHRAFLAYLMAVLLFMAGINGLVAPYLTPNNPAVGDHWVSIMVFVVTGLAAHFHRCILDVDRRTPALNLFFRGTIWLSVACFLAYLAGYFTEAARVLTLAAAVFPILGIVRTAVMWRRGRAGSGFLALAFTCGLASYLITVMSVQGMLPGGHLQLYSFQAGSLAALLAFNFGLFERLRHVQREHDKAVEDARRARSERDAESLARGHLSAMLAMLTHELKTPLSVIRLRLGMANASERMQANATRSVDEIDGIVERCAMAVRLDEQAMSVTCAACDLPGVVYDAAAKTKGGGRIEFRHAPGLSGALHSDPALLTTLIANLLENALKYSPPDTPVEVVMTERAADGRAGLQLSVANQAGAAGKPDPGKLFEKYYRAPGAHGQSGSGLGLYIVRALAVMLGGRIDYRADRPDIVFELWLPRSTC